MVLTQIGGLINDNANLRGTGAASVILNEVTSNRISRVNGYVEIAGKRADLIIANQNGISFAGAGFINVDRLSAIVGSLNPEPRTSGCPHCQAMQKNLPSAGSTTLTSLPSAKL